MLRNNVNLVGRLTKDIEIKKTNSGKAVKGFTADRKPIYGILL